MTQIHTGDTHNVIPNEAFLEGTMRAFDVRVRDQVTQRMEDIIKGVAAALGCEASFEIDHATIPVVNDPEVTARLRPVLAQVVGGEDKLRFDTRTIRLRRGGLAHRCGDFGLGGRRVRDACMSAPQPTLTWPDALGWLVLSGTSEGDGAVRAEVLQRLKPEGGVAYLGLRESALDAVMDDLDDLGAPTGYLVNILTEDDDQIRASLREVSLIVLDSEEDPQRLYETLQGAAIEAVRAAYERGAVVLAEGQAAGLLGAYWRDRRGVLREGLGWLREAFVCPDLPDREQLRAEAVEVFERHPEALAVGIPTGAALALGVGGHLELWGDRPVAVTFGPGFLKHG
ncbi:MAG: hypothetical protein MUC99_10165 [Anaerolineae bacterium]|nr:hypothetical protein [Anaerolineae bacterium]